MMGAKRPSDAAGHNAKCTATSGTGLAVPQVVKCPLIKGAHNATLRY